MQGNSLISEFMGINFDDDENKHLKEKISALETEEKEITKRIKEKEKEQIQFYNKHHKQDEALSSELYQLNKNKKKIGNEINKNKEEIEKNDSKSAEISELLEEFQQKKDEFLNESNVSRKAALKEKVENLLIEIFESKLKKEKADLFNRLENIRNKYAVLPNEKQRNEIIKQEEEKLYKGSGFDLEAAEKQLKEFTSGRQIKPFFLWNLYFSEVFHQPAPQSGAAPQAGEKGGFDVVIANPPYVSTYTITKKDKSFFNNEFQTAYKKYDIYVLFFEKGLTLLKNSGVLTYITSNKYFSQPYGYKLRKLLLQNSIEEIINFRTQVFEAAVDTAINLTKKQQPHTKKKFKLLECNKPEDVFLLNKLARTYYPHSIFKNMPEYNFRLSLTEDKLQLIKKIQNSSYEIADICYVNYGCRLVSKSGKKKKKDYVFSQKEHSKLKPFIEGQDVRKYCIISSRWVNYSPSEHYLSLFNELFENKKIVAKDIVGRNGAQIALDTEMFYNDHTVINAVNWHLLKDVKYKPVKRQLTEEKISVSKNFKQEFLLGVLNSKLSNFYFYELFNIDLHFYPNTFQKMPIPKCPTTNNRMEKLISEIIKLVKNDEYQNSHHERTRVIALENQIDQMVYDLYGLTENEIKIVEGEGKSS